MTHVHQCLQTKGDQVWSIHPDASVYDALVLMAEKNIGALLVMDGDNLEGIFSERDYARKVILRNQSSKDIAVKEVMTAKVIYVQPNVSLEDCMALMTEKRIRHLPVLDGGQLVGLISIGDVVKQIISDKKFVIKQLENYITGGR